MFEKSRKYIIIAVLIFLLVLSFYLCLVFNVNLWFGFAFFVGILIFIFLANWSIKSIFVKYKKYKQNMDKIEQVPKRSLLDSFNLALDSAKKYINKNKQKQPWFIVFGSSQSGKSSLFNTGSESKNAYGYCWTKENFTTAEINGDIFLDKPSKASIVSFEILLNNIKKALRLNRIDFKGFIITLSVEELKKGDEYLSAYASKMRSRLDRSFYKLGFRYPIYMLITKADKLQGFESFSLELPDKLTNNAFGELFNEKDLFNRSGDSIINAWIEKLRKRIRVYNTVCLQTNNSLLPRALLLEKSLKGIESRLVSFINELLREKQEQSSKDKPLLRGMFLTSSNNSDISRNIDKGCLLETLDLKVNTRSNNKKLYVQNLFKDIIPHDVNLYKPLHKRLKRKKNYKKGLFFLWWISLISMTIYLAFAYTHTLKIFNQVKVSNQIENQYFGKDLSHNFKSMLNISNNIDKIIQLKQSWFFSIWPYAIPFDYAIDKLKGNYVLTFDKHIDDKLKQSTEASVNLVLQGKYSDYYGKVVRRLLESKILIDQKLKGNISNFDSSNMPSVLIGDKFDSNSYGILYKKYIEWNNNSKQLKLLRSFDENLLGDMNIPEHSYDWLILWANESKKVPSIRMSDYWFKYKGTNEPKIDIAYNVLMLPNIKKFVANIDKYANPLEAPSYSSKFFAYYSLSAYRAWRNFTNEFHANDRTVPTETSWYTVLEQNSYDGFYINYANRLLYNFETNLFINKPEWLKLFIRLDAYFSLSEIMIEKKVQLNKDSWFTKIVSRLNNTPDEINKQKDIPNYSQKVLDAVNAYLLSIYFLQTQALSLEDQASYETMLSLASNTNNSSIPAIKGVREAYKNFINLKVITKSNISDLSVNSNEVTWNFYRDNLNLLLYGISRKASCYIESVWDDTILKKDKISTSTTISQLYGRRTLIYKFMQKYVYPFVEYDPMSKKFVAKSKYGEKINFSKEVYKYLDNEIYYRNLISIANNLESLLKNQGRQTTIHTDPVSVNKKAKLLPYSTVYTFVCNGKKESFTNYNTSLDFSIPSRVLSCASMSIKVNFRGVDNFTASKMYSGEYPIIQLLSDTNDKGELILKSNKFVGAVNKLDAYGIKFISIPISLKDMDLPPLIKKYKKNRELLIKNSLKGQMFEVASCWKQ